MGTPQVDPCPFCGRLEWNETGECEYCAGFTRLSEMHQAKVQEIEHRARARDAITSLAILGAVYAAALGVSFYLRRDLDSSPLVAATLGAGSVAVAALGFKMSAVAILDEYAPYSKALILAIVAFAAISAGCFAVLL